MKIVILIVIAIVVVYNALRPHEPGTTFSGRGSDWNKGEK